MASFSNNMHSILKPVNLIRSKPSIMKSVSTWILSTLCIIIPKYGFPQHRKHQEMAHYMESGITHVRLHGVPSNRTPAACVRTSSSMVWKLELIHFPFATTHGAIWSLLIFHYGALYHCNWLVHISLTKIIPNCILMDPPIIDLQLGLMETVWTAWCMAILVSTNSTLTP